ncbi:hypothetical protein QW180_03130 [Vibrio sinaloensis]|nr:hypothetical protein [Vibrio sinaloensis]
MSYHRVMVKGMVIWGISVTCYATTSLNVAQDIWPPYVMDTPIGEGIAHDIVTQGLVRAGYKFAYQHKPWARVLKETYYGKKRHYCRDLEKVPSENENTISQSLTCITIWL